MISYDICLSVSDLLHSVWQSVGLSMLLQMALFCSFLWLSHYHIFFTHWSLYGHLGCFHVLAIVHSTAMNIGEHVSLVYYRKFLFLHYPCLILNATARRVWLSALFQYFEKFSVTGLNSSCKNQCCLGLCTDSFLFTFLTVYSLLSSPWHAEPSSTTASRSPSFWLPLSTSLLLWFIGPRSLLWYWLWMLLWLQ